MKFFPIVLFAIFFTGCTTSGFDVSAFDLKPPRFGDAKPVKFEGGSPNAYPVHGVDVSKYQGDINWRTLKSRGVSFAFIKATEGGDHVDEAFKKYWRGAKRAGIPRGAYHFYYFCTTAHKQAVWFINNVPRDSTALPPVLDAEWNHGSKTCKKKPAPGKVLSAFKIFLKLLERHYKKRPIIYTSPDFYQDTLKNGFGRYTFWLRSVTSHPSRKFGRQRWKFWQYTGTGLTPGVKGKIDLNAFNGSMGAFNRWLKSVTSLR
jgi:lysozyme